MNIKQLRAITELTQKDFATKFNIPLRTLQTWEAGHRVPPPYVIAMINRIIALEVKLEIIEHRDVLKEA